VQCDLSLPEARHRAQGVDWHKRQIDLSAAVRAVAYAGAIYGHPGTVARGLPDPDLERRTADGLHQLAECAAERSVALVLEPMSHFRTHVANTPGQINAFIARAEHANLLSLLDTYHFTTEVTDLSAAFDEMRPRLWGLHACENNRGAPGTGMLPWAALGRTIASSGWDGYIGFEGYNSTWRNGAFARERGMFHNVCPNAEAFIRQSIDFMNSILSHKNS
jgi:D-psicose/D-tagatose/L-ribulose 3-epimerase